MNRINRWAGRFGIVLCSALLGCTAWSQPSVSVGVSVPLPSVQIHVESDFYEPLAPHGEWLVVGSYGRCWRPGHVDRDWRPYCNGSWERTDDGWYWVSDEPWAWATYHYGRWDYTDQYGWYWVPQTQWAPAWVSWHSGGGYIGWAPLLPSVRMSAGGYVGFNVALVSPRAFVFVEQRRFLEPIRPTTVVVNNTTIIKQTTIISNARMVNNTVINEGPSTAAIEKASGRKIQAVPVQELRHRTEAAVVSKRAPAETSEKKARTPARSEVKAPEKKTVPAREAAQIEKPAATTHEPAKLAPKKNEAQSETRNSVPATAESKPAARPEANHSPAIKEPAQPKADQRVAKQGKPDKQVQPPARENPGAGEKGGSGPADRDREKKTKE